ncbi:PAS domain-containing protein [Aquabacterium fontiphilum]|uniref:ATP-binding protein n=1 Tax=Aquabacterium fontiphilum TaxID=450365 RepID=UPI001377498F|nr:ATP-binding protein [Aquabacterium fontiphilum]NBD21734.1 PAS domain-containing protein [Aquabacterium fontiphilum]
MTPAIRMRLQALSRRRQERTAGVASGSIRVSLAWLAALCLLPGILVTVTLIALDQRQRQQEAEQAVLTSARVLASSLDRELSAVLSGLRVLASDPALQQGDLATFHQRALDALPHQNVANFVLIDRDAQQRVNTLRPWGVALPAGGAPPEIRRIHVHGKAVVSDLFVGPVTGTPVVALGVPVRVGDEVPYSLNVGIEPERITRMMRSQLHSPDWIAQVMDRNGTIIARTHEGRRFIGQPASPELLKSVLSQRHGALRTQTLEGIPVVVAFQHLAGSDWSVAVGIPLALVESGWRTSLGSVLVAHLVMFALAVSLAWRQAFARFVRPMEGLLERMRRLSRNEDPGPRCTGSGTAELQAMELGFERMRAHIQQREAERQGIIDRLTDTLESMGDGFLMVDAAGCITYVNQQAERLLGRERQQLLGQMLSDTFPAPEARPLLEACQQAWHRHAGDSLVVPLSAQQRWLEADVHPSEWGLALYFRDVSEAQRLREAQAAKLVAEAANKAKTEFLSRMSHELRTPLNAVLGFAQLLRLDSTTLTARHASMVQRIETAGQHLLEMISEVLDLSRIESGSLPVRPSAVDAAELATTCHEMLDEQARMREVRLTLLLDPAPLTVHADPTRLKQVLINLMGNAIKYNRPGGEATLVVQREGDRLRFEVRDTGQGLTPEQQAHLFEPFNRLGREQGSEAGTGIGLVITQRLVSMMGGELQVACVAGEGCRFWFALPGTEAAEPAAVQLPSGNG